MTTNTVWEKILQDKGIRHSWMINKMNDINPSLRMNRCKFSSIVQGKRKITADELLTFCRVLELNPNVFIRQDVNERGCLNVD